MCIYPGGGGDRHELRSGLSWPQLDKVGPGGTWQKRSDSLERLPATTARGLCAPIWLSPVPRTLKIPFFRAPRPGQGGGGCHDPVAHVCVQTSSSVTCTWQGPLPALSHGENLCEGAIRSMQQIPCLLSSSYTGVFTFFSLKSLFGAAGMQVN